MINIDKRPFRADGGDISTGRLKEIADNPYGDEEKSWLAKRVLALLEDNTKIQREKDVMESAALAMRDDMRLACEQLGGAEKRITELERDETQLITERDSAEQALADMYEAAMGERPEWSNLFGYAEAIDDVAQRINFLDLAAATAARKGE